MKHECCFREIHLKRSMNCSTFTLQQRIFHLNSNQIWRTWCFSPSTIYLNNTVNAAALRNTNKASPGVCPLGRWASGWTLARVLFWLVFLSKQRKAGEMTRNLQHKNRQKRSTDVSHWASFLKHLKPSSKITWKEMFRVFLLMLFNNRKKRD